MAQRIRRHKKASTCMSYGIEGAYDKFIRLLDEYDFVSVAQAIKGIDWESVRKIEI